MNTVKCPLCHVDVPIDKIDLPNRCLHPQCPLNKGRGNDPQCAQVSGSRKAPLLGSDVTEVFFLMLAVIAGVGVAVFLFVIEPRRKIYDYDPHDPRQ